MESILKNNKILLNFKGRKSNKNNKLKKTKQLNAVEN